MIHYYQIFGLRGHAYTYTYPIFDKNNDYIYI